MSTKIDRKRKLEESKLNCGEFVAELLYNEFTLDEKELDEFKKNVLWILLTEAKEFYSNIILNFLAKEVLSKDDFDALEKLDTDDEVEIEEIMNFINSKASKIDIDACIRQVLVPQIIEGMQTKVQSATESQIFADPILNIIKYDGLNAVSDDFFYQVRNTYGHSIMDDGKNAFANIIAVVLDVLPIINDKQIVNSPIFNDDELDAAPKYTIVLYLPNTLLKFNNTILDSIVANESGLLEPMIRQVSEIQYNTFEDYCIVLKGDKIAYIRSLIQ
jgi:hypothetical protein